MKTELSKADLMEFYKSASFEHRADAILAVGVVAREARRWKRIAAVSIVTCASLCIATATLFIHTENRKTDPLSTFPVGQKVATPQNLPVVRLVSVVTHTDACPLCKQIGDIVAELRSQFREDPVMFLALDLSDDVEKKQTGMIIELLGFELPENYSGPSYFVLNASGEVLQELEGATEQEQLAMHLRRHLARR